MMLYHLSERWLGQRVTLAPRIPRDRAPFEDRRVRRICVAPTVQGCLLALRGCFYNRGVWWIYATSGVDAVEPISVPDASETGERWLLHPTEMVCVRRITIST